MKETLYQFSDYVLDTAELTLSKNSTEIIAEPKVLELLAYFCQHNERYIQLQELHDNVWQGRIVSDAAVRRVISKARTLLEDDINNPLYIKSVARRGYKFVCPVTELERTEFNIATSFVNGNSPGTKGPYSYWQKAALAASALIISILVYLYSAVFFSSLDPIEYIDFPGEKTALATSNDGRLVAFTGRMDADSKFQVFLYDHKTKSSTQLTTSAENAYVLDFSSDGKSLFYVDLIPGNSSINKLDLTYESAESKMLLEGFYLIADVDVLNDGSGLYFNAMRKKTSLSQLYFYSFATKKAEQVSSMVEEEHYDFNTALSPDNSLLAAISRNGKDSDYEVTVYNEDNYKVNKRFFFTSIVHEIAWLNERTLLCLTREALVKLDIESGDRQELDYDYPNQYLELDVYGSGQLVLLENPKAERFFTQADLGNLNQGRGKVIATDKNIKQMMFLGNSGSYLIIERNGYMYMLKAKMKDGQKELFKTSLPLEVWDVSPDASVALLTLDGQLVLLNLKNSELHYITQAGQILAPYTAFSKDGSNVYYGVSGRYGWQVMKYNLATRQQSVYASGYMVALDLSSGRIIIDPEFKVFYQQSGGEASPLGITITPEVNSRMFVRDDQLIWSQYKFQDTIINSYSLKTGELSSHKFDTNTLSARIDISKDGNTMLLKNQRAKKNRVLRAEL